MAKLHPSTSRLKTKCKLFAITWQHMQDSRSLWQWYFICWTVW